MSEAIALIASELGQAGKGGGKLNSSRSIKLSADIQLDKQYSIVTQLLMLTIYCAVGFAQSGYRGVEEGGEQLGQGVLR